MRVNQFLSASFFALSALIAGDTMAATSVGVETITPDPTLLRDRPLEDYAGWQAPAAGDSRPADDFADNYANDAGAALFFAPGVFVNRLDAAEPRLIIRGYGVNNRQERSTVRVLRDGAPLTDVHGETNTAEIDLMAVSRVDIYRGGGGDLRIAGGNLGGAINFVSPTGLTARYNRSARFDVGSSIDGTPGGQAHADLAHATGSVDYYVSLTGRYETGYRDNNQRIDAIFNSNIGYQFSPSFSTRFFVEALRSDTELAGGLTPLDMSLDPSQAMPAITLGPLFPGGPIINLTDGAETDEFGRTLIVGRVSNQTDFRLLALDFDVGLHFAHREIESPQIDYIGVIDETGNEWGGNLTIGKVLRIFGMQTDLRLGGAYTTGAKTSDRFENIDGSPGDNVFATRQKSTNVTGFVEAALNPLKSLLVEFGAKFIMVDRELTVDDNLEEARYIGVAARGGVFYTLTKKVQLFANAARIYEPPSFSELVSDNPEDINGLDEQDAFTYEAGVRGRLNGWLGWDLTVFNADVENEIINIEEPETNGLGTLVNVESTTHRGVEAGFDINLFPSRFARSGHALTLRNAYSYNDFHFNIADPLDVDGNRLAGLPEHIYRGELRYSSDGRWFAGVNVEVAAGNFYADHENVVSAPTYTLVGFSAGWRMNDAMELFASGENLTDQNYAAGITPVLSQTVQNGRVFTPGDGASVYGGLRMRF